MNLTRVLLIEDDAAIRRGVCDALAAAGFAVTPVESGERGLALLAGAADYDLVLLDVVLPGRDGMHVLSVVREQRPALPVIMLTALGRVEDRVRGLRLGADDYVVKPFNVVELLARVEAVLRRSPDRSLDTPELELEHCVINLQRREIRFPNGRLIELSEKEHDLLRYFTANAGRVVSRDELIERVWELNPKRLQTRTVDMHVARLREKLSDNAASPKLIVTVRGQGYRFEPVPAVSPEVPT